MSTDAIGDNDGGLEQQVETEIKEALSFDHTGDPIIDAAINRNIRQPKYHVVLPDDTELVLDTIEYMAYKKLFPKMREKARERVLKQVAEEAAKGQLDSRLAQLATQAERKQHAEEAQATEAANKKILELTADLAALVIAKKLEAAGWNVSVK